MKELFQARINFNLFKFNLKQNRGLLIVFTLMLSLTFPVIVLVNAVSNNNYSISEDDIRAFMLLMSLMLIFLLVLTPFIFFNYLNSKKSVDVYHSLSITRNDLFLTFFILSLFFVIVPLSIAYWGGFIITYLTSDVGFDPYHVFHYGRLLMISIAIMSTSIFVIMNTGTLSDSLVYTGIILVAPFIAYGAYQLFAQVHIIGFQTANLDSLVYLSPLAGIFYIFENMSTTIDGHFIASYWLLLGIAMNGISMNLYKEWKSEYSEVPFSNNKFFPLVTSLFIGILFIFLLSINFNTETNSSFLSIENLLIPTIFTYSFYLILNIIKFRSINTVKKASIRYFALFLAIIILTSTLYYTQGFGYSYRLPEKEDIKSINLSGSFQGDPFLNSNDFVVKDSDTIKEILEIHKMIVGYVEKDKNIFIENSNSDLKDSLNVYGPNGEYGNLNLTYNLNNNDTMKRSYSIPTEMQHIFFGLVESDDFTQNNQPISNSKNKISEIQVYDPLFSEQYFFDFNLKDEKFRKAIEQDLLAMDEETYFKSENPIEMTLVYWRDSSDDTEFYDYRAYQLNIDSRFDATINYLNKDRITRTSVNTDSFYQIVEAKDVKNFWVGHGISQTLQQDQYGYYEGGEMEVVNKDDYRNKIFDKRLSKDTNDILIIDTMYGRVIYPIITE